MRSVRILRRATIRAVAVLLAGIVCVGTSGLGHTAWDDPACDPIPVHHDHNAHHARVSGGTLPASPDSDHCLFCHSLRALRTALVAAQTPVAPDGQSARVRAADAVLAGRLFDPSAPSRAPPVVFL